MTAQPANKFDSHIYFELRLNCRGNQETGQDDVNLTNVQLLQHVLGVDPVVLVIDKMLLAATSWHAFC